MAEVLVIGKKISEMGLVNEITGEEKIPTSVVGDKAVTTSQLLTYVNNNGVAQWGRIGGDIANQVDLQNQFTQERDTLKSYTQEQVSQESENLKGYTQDQISQESENLKSYTQDQISQESENLKTYTQEQVSQQQVALQEHIDTTNEVFKYARDNGSALPYKAGVAYEENAVVVKDGELQQWKDGEWILVNSDSEITTWSGRTQESKNNDYVHIKDFGGVGDGVTDDSAAFALAFQSGRNIKFEGTHLIRNPVSVTISKASSVAYDFSAASIVVDDTISTPLGTAIFLKVDQVVNLELLGFNMDASNKAANALYISQPLAQTICNLTIKDAVIKNVRRTMAHLTQPSHASLGNGIFIRGGFDRITLDGVTINEVTLEKGSGVESVVGIAGITISRVSSDGVTYSYNKLTCNNILISGVYCYDDQSHFIDQDGIRILSYAPTDTETWQGGIFAPISKTDIGSCLFINCRGRAIKSQAMMTDVSNVTIVRRGVGAVANGSGMGDIDFQHGGGKVDNVRLYYTGGGCSYNVIVCTGNRYDAQLYNDFFSISNVLLVTHNASPTNFINAPTRYSIYYMLNVSGIQHYAQQSAGRLENFIRYTCSDNTTPYARRFILNASDCNVVIDSAGYALNDAPTATMLSSNKYKEVARDITISNTTLRGLPAPRLQYLADPENFDKFVSVNNLHLSNVIGFDNSRVLTRIAGQLSNYVGTVQPVTVAQRSTTTAGNLMDSLTLVANVTNTSRPFVIGTNNASNVVVELILKLSNPQYYKFMLSCASGNITPLEQPPESTRLLVYGSSINAPDNPAAHTTCFYDTATNKLTFNSSSGYSISMHVKF